MENNALRDELDSLCEVDESGFYSLGEEGYWSLLNEEEYNNLAEKLETMPARAALKENFSDMDDIIFSPKRDAGLEILELTGEEVCIDYGCMWGALTIPLAKRAKYVLAIDQTKNSLKFVKARARDEKLDNVGLLCHNLKRMPVLKNKVDVALVNGVLEWIPEEGKVEIKEYWGKNDQKKREHSVDPRTQQLNFLKIVRENLADDGRLYLAIENRYDYKMFFGIQDPHSGLLFTSFLPRWLADVVSKATVGRKYVNWIYSFGEIDELLKEAGYSSVELYASFPDYRFPECIYRYDKGLEGFNGTRGWRGPDGKFAPRRVIGRALELLILKYLKLKFFSPSIIAIAKK